MWTTYQRHWNGSKKIGLIEWWSRPTHVINGEEYEKMTAQVQPWIDRFASIVVGRPLLTESDDYQAVCSAVLKQFPKLKEEEALVLMGHGTEHSADAAYAAMAYRFRAMGHNNVFVGTVEGYPALEEPFAPG